MSVLFLFFCLVKALKEYEGAPVPDIEKKDKLLGHYWEAQMESINASVSACAAK